MLDNCVYILPGRGRVDIFKLGTYSVVFHSGVKIIAIKRFSLKAML